VYEPGKDNELAFVRSFDRDREVGTGKEVGDGDSFQAQGDAWHRLFRRG
jgi:hypothetical protein